VVLTPTVSAALEGLRGAQDGQDGDGNDKRRAVTVTLKIRWGQLLLCELERS